MEAIEKIRNPKYYIEHYLTIRTKAGLMETLKMKPAQERLYETICKLREEKKPVRLVILKARQLGFSTLIESLYFHQTATKRNIRTLIVAHDSDSTANLFRMNKLFYDCLPDVLKPMRTASNAQEIVFDNPERDAKRKSDNPGLNSSIRCVPATGSGVGRSSTLTNIHASEVAFWRDMKETFTALLQAVPDDPTTSVIIETTPNGFNDFKEFWDMSVEGKTGFIPLFFPWFEEPGYVRPVEKGVEWSKEEEELRALYHLTDEQLSWRRWCIATNLTGDEEKFKQEYPSCAEEAFLTSGRPFFNNTIIIKRINELTINPKRGRFVYEENEGGLPLNPHFEESYDGEIFLYGEPDYHRPYVCGGDTSGDGSDRFTGFLLDNHSGSQVAQLLYDGNSELYYAQQMYCLGKYFNNALMGIEINFSTYPEKKLEEWGYQNLYIREKPDDSRGKLSAYKLGWRTDMRTRPLILANLHTTISECPEMFNDDSCLRECLTFVRNDDMRPEAAQGKHDDMVMAMAIAHYIRPQQSYEISEEPEIPKKKLIDILDPKKKQRRRHGFIR